MDKYKQFSPEDLVWDEDFRHWVLTPTRETNQAWQEWLTVNPEMEIRMGQAREIVLALHTNEHSLSEKEIQQLIRRTIARTTTRDYSQSKSKQPIELPSVFYQNPWFQLAASFVLIIGVGLSIWVWRSNAPVQLAENITYQTQIARESGSLIEKVNTSEKSELIQLEDGSRITLKKGSRISYKSPFVANKREVYLSGEAFFEITPNSERPFLVYANELVTKVLGTSFWITAYDTAKEITVKVKTGRVSVFAKNDPAIREKTTNRELQGVILTPNQKIVFARKEIRMIKSLVEKPRIVSQNPVIEKFEFEDRPVSEVFGLLQEAYGVEIIYNKELMRGCPITAALGSLSLYQKLDVICKAIEANYEIIDGQIVIHSKGCKN